MPPLPERIDDDDASVDLMQVFSRLWHHRVWIIVSVVVAILVAMAAIRLINPAYTIEMKITPAGSSDDVSGKLGQFGGLAAAAGISLGKAESASPFDLYLEMMRSRDLARALARDQRIMQTIFDAEWDSSTRRWRQPTSVTGSIKEFLRTIVGAPAQPWHAPDAARLQGYLAKEIIIARGTKDPVTRVVYEFPDPVFGQYLLGRLAEETDAIVRRQALNRAAAYVRYLTVKLPSVLVVEQRQALTSILSDQEKAIMMASTPLPYAALRLDTINASDYPTKPNGFLIIFAAIAIGLIVGTIAALIDWSRLRVVPAAAGQG